MDERLPHCLSSVSPELFCLLEKVDEGKRDPYVHDEEEDRDLVVPCLFNGKRLVKQGDIDTQECRGDQGNPEYQFDARGGYGFSYAVPCVQKVQPCDAHDDVAHKYDIYEFHLKFPMPCSP